MDTARCLCTSIARALRCPFHGDSPKDPLKPYVLTDSDKAILRSMRIAFTDSAEIQQIRQADEDRFRRD
jgi:hypothetical protein